MGRRREGRLKSLENLRKNHVLEEENIGASGDNQGSFHGQRNRETDISWQEGRRVVEIGFLAKRLQCLLDTVRETRQGLGSILYIKCGYCDSLTAVPTGKRHSGDDITGATRIFDINTKMAAAMVNAGVGHSQINNILAEVNLPPICHKTLKKREREIGDTIEAAVEESCDQAIVEELELLQFLSSQASSSSSTVKAEAALDGGWQKRGTGRCRNSLSGHVTVIGKQKKKVISYGVAKKHCRVCSYSSRFRTRPRAHRCRRNWNGSSKGMEPFLAINCLIKLKEKGFHIKRIIMDDDTTTLTRARHCVYLVS